MPLSLSFKNNPFKTNFIKKFLLAIAAVMFMVSCTQINQGEVGLKVYQLGSKKGQIEVLGPGRYAIHMFGYFSYEKYPTNLQQWSWTMDEGKGSPANEQVSFQAEGQDLNADIGIEYEFMSENPEMMINMYRHFRRSPNEIVQDFMRKDVRSFFNKVVQNMPVEDVYSSAKGWQTVVMSSGQAGQLLNINSRGK